MTKEQEKSENTAKAVGKDLSISTKMAVEVCSFIRKKNLQKAKNLLQEVISMKKAIPIKRYNKGLAHKKKMGPGRYPVNTSKKILELLEGVEANAQFKGLSTDDLIITHIKADKAATPWHYGRQRRRKMKRTHIEVIVTEKIDKKKDDKKEAKEKTKAEKKEEKIKKENKPEKEKKVEEKPKKISGKKK